MDDSKLLDATSMYFEDICYARMKVRDNVIEYGPYKYGERIEVVDEGNHNYSILFDKKHLIVKDESIYFSDICTDIQKLYIKKHNNLYILSNGTFGAMLSKRKTNRFPVYNLVPSTIEEASPVSFQ
ncbi:hypothetical protein BB560_007078 [Smittium megazygosporum]|uniref:Uncharacterized protein n=1 Tax=Smittium megazygosporum TaxID=133381 RepID=A0A2T9XYW4_9FUNG|nr:hypothetical protein BB560_007078 [Smittium megazygosporum]